MTTRRRLPLSLLALLVLCLFALGPAHAGDEWIGEVHAAPLMSPPFTKTYYAGELLRIEVKAGQVLRLSQGEDSNGGLVIVIPTKDGKRAGKKTILKDAPILFGETREETDALALKIFTGKIELVAQLDSMDEHVVEEGQAITIPLTPGRETLGRIVNLSDYRSSTTFRFLKSGQDISEGSDRSRTISLEFRGSALEKTWKTDADTVEFKVHRGRMLFKAGHPFAGSGG